MKDLLFERKYGKLYETIENGVCEVFAFKHSLGSIRHMFIKREVPIQLHNEKFYDITTPYGYGGPVIENCKTGKEKELAKEFKKEFQKYCDEKNIISEFIRFHPVVGNAEDFTDCYEVIYMRDTVGTNLKAYDDPVQSEFSKSTRKSIRKALRAGVEYKVIVNPESLSNFKKIYHATMKRINADNYYYFDDAYFSDCLKYFGKYIVLVEAHFQGQVIGMELHFLYKNIMHTHLSGSVEEFHHLFPVYVMQYGIAQWGKENGVDVIHAGGGLSNDPEDTLYLFKKKFGKNTSFQFYIGRKVWNEKIYVEICSAAGVGEEEEFFPAYRSKAAKEISGV